jgi:hypothetical protein
MWDRQGERREDEVAQPGAPAIATASFRRAARDTAAIRRSAVEVVTKPERV